MALPLGSPRLALPHPLLSPELGLQGQGRWGGWGAGETESVPRPHAVLQDIL